MNCCLATFRSSNGLWSFAKCPFAFRSHSTNATTKDSRKYLHTVFKHSMTYSIQVGLCLHSSPADKRFTSDSHFFTPPTYALLSGGQGSERRDTPACEQYTTRRRKSIINDGDKGRYFQRILAALTIVPTTVRPREQPIIRELIKVLDFILSVCMASCRPVSFLISLPLAR